MKVHIQDGFYVVSDERQFMLREYTGKYTNPKDGSEPEEVYKVHGYYTSLSELMKKVLHLKLDRSTATTIEELLLELKETKRYLERMTMELAS